MGLISFFKKLTARNDTSLSLEDKELLEWLGVDPRSHKAITEVTYFTCLKMLSETMGKMPLKYYQEVGRGRIRAEPTEASIALMVRPNNYLTPTTLWTYTEFCCQHYGNAYIYIHSAVAPSKFGGSLKVLGLYPMAPNSVTVKIDPEGVFGGKGEIYYQYSDSTTGKQYVFSSDEVMHFKTWYTKDGILGESVRAILKDTVDGANEGSNYLNNLYKQGLTARLAMQYPGELDDARVRQLEKRFADMMTGPKNAGKVVPIPIGLKLEPLNMSLADAQFSELRKYTALQIAGAFGIKPNQINNYEKSSYSNSEMQQLAFLVDTMAYRLKMYEDEINAKMLTPEEKRQGFFYKFNEKSILRTDAKTQMESLSTAVQNAIYTPNEAREYLDLPAEEGGDILMANGNYIPITMVGSQYGKGGDNSGEN